MFASAVKCASYVKLQKRMYCVEHNLKINNIISKDANSTVLDAIMLQDKKCYYSA